MSHPPRRRNLKRLLIIAGAVAATLAAFYPIAIHPDSAVIFLPGDQTSTARDLWAAHAQRQTPFTLVRDELMNAPIGRPLAPAVQWANAVQPLFVMATHGLVGYLGALNLFILVGIVASLVAMFFLLTSFGLDPIASGCAAVAFAWSPWMMEQLDAGHVAFAHMWVLPLLLAALLWAWRGRPRRSVGAGLALALAFYTFSYLGLIASFLVIAFFLAALFERQGRRYLLERLVVFGLTAFVALLPAALAPRLAPSSFLSLPSLSRHDLNGARLSDFLVPSSRNPVYGDLVNRLFGSHYGESVTFFGYGILALALCAVVLLATSRLSLGLPQRVALFSVVIGWLMALPAFVKVGGTYVPLPTAAYLMGGVVSYWRWYSRVAALMGFGLCTLAAFALDWLLRRRSVGALAVASGIALVVLVEALPGLPLKVTRMQADPVTRWLRAHPGGLVASFPVESSDENATWHQYVNTAYYFQMKHRHPLFSIPHDANSLPDPPRPQDVVALLSNDLTRPRTLGLLRGEGVRYLVVHDDVYRSTGRRPPRLAHGVVQVATFPGVRVFRIVKPATDPAEFVQRHMRASARAAATGSATVIPGRGFYPGEPYRGYNAHWLRQDGQLRVVPALGKPYIQYRLSVLGFSSAVGHHVRITVGDRIIASFEMPTYETTVEQAVRLPRAQTWTVHVAPDPAPLSSSDTRAVSVFFESISVDPVGVDLASEASG